MFQKRKNKNKTPAILLEIKEQVFHPKSGLWGAENRCLSICTQVEKQHNPIRGRNRTPIQ